MANVMHNSHVHPPRPETKKNTTQTISLLVGFLLFVVGLSGLLFPSFMGLHLSILISTIIAVAGATLFYNGYKIYSRGAFHACLGFGIFFGLYSLVGLIFSDPGGISTGGATRLGILPNISELSPVDHTFNGVLAVILLIGAYDWHRNRTNRRSLIP